MTVVYDPDRFLDAGVPLDRAAHLRLAREVIAAGVGGAPRLTPEDYQQAALQLTGHAQLVAREVRAACEYFASYADARVLAELVLDEAERRMVLPLRGTMQCATMRARLVRSLYERLDRLQSAAAAPLAAP
ncbi:restriction endonuclease [Streptomyces sp. NPDC090442]|uniref:restriction endonuclease n=1 Tax=Streptomyces sp. NPDC090442 TaxID=3365962 RepID=UPI00380CC42A